MVLVTGAGRSGTSTAAGALSLLGVHVPGPFLKANASNPKGFYESRWSVRFHNDLLGRANVTLADGRPEAVEDVRAAIGEKDRSRLRAWVESATEGHALTAVKDPRTTWTLRLWSQVADEVAVSPRFLTMLRHPAEVIGSRATHYAAGIDALGERGFAVKNLAGWVNAMLLTEQQTRGRHRAFVRYDDLLSDWRTAMASASTAMDIDLDLGPAEENPVDEFIDPDLSRHHLGWADVDVPGALREVATDVWEACERLAEAKGSDPEAEASLDAAGQRYATMYLDAQQLTSDSTAARVKQALAEVEAHPVEQATSGDAGARPAGESSAGGGAALRGRTRAALGRLRRRALNRR